MAYTLKQLVEDCRAALTKDKGAIGRNAVRKFVELACLDDDFVSTHLGPENDTPRKVLYEDDELGFCILVHVAAAETGLPHGHGPTWAIYGIAAGITEMTDWYCTEQPQGRTPGKVVKVRSYEVPKGTAHLYNEGDLHSSRREQEVRMVRVEGINLMGTRRPRYEAQD